MNIINGGVHANNSLKIQEFMIRPIGASSFSKALRMGAEIFHHLKSILKSKGLSTAVGDEGGFAPSFVGGTEEALDSVLKAIAAAGYKAGEEITIAMDFAASEFYEEGNYNYAKFEGKNGKVRNSAEQVTYLTSLIDKYPIISIEDGLDENDWQGWKKLNNKLGTDIQIVGDDLTVTNIKRLQRAIDENSMNSILIKLNQIGTITETIQAIELAKKVGYGAIISHRSGETEDTIIADFSVAMGMGQIKTGSASRSDRVSKYNQLLRIEEELGNCAELATIEMLGQNK